MQSTQLSSKHSNIFSEMREIKETITNGYKSNLLKFAYQRNPDSLLDETLLFIWALMLIACAFTVAFGGYYHYSMLQNAFGVGIWSVIGSFAVFVALEIAKVYLGLVFTRSLFSGLWYKSIYRALFTLLLGLIVVVAFQWSINISTKGVSLVNTLTKTEQLYKDNTFTLPPQVAEIDRQLAEIETSKKAGANSVWKGVTTTQGLRVIRDNTKLQAELLKQKNDLLAAAQMQFDSTQNNAKQQISATATLLTDYGGKAEWAQVVFILLIVLFEFINYRNNTQHNGAKLTALKTVDTAHHTTQPFSTNTIGFKLPNTQAKTLVSQPTQPTQPTPTQHSHTAHTTQVVVAPSEDVSKLKNYCREYYKRSFTSANESTRQRNKEEYEKYKALLEIAGLKVEPGPGNSLIIV